MTFAASLAWVPMAPDNPSADNSGDRSPAALRFVEVDFDRLNAASAHGHRLARLAPANVGRCSAPTVPARRRSSSWRPGTFTPLVATLKCSVAALGTQMSERYEKGLRSFRLASPG